MATWQEIESEAPELAALARRFFDSGVHKTIATLRRDGSPRISGTEANFAPEGLWLGSMPRAKKALDLQRDPRFALHSASPDPPDWKGDAKVSGRVIEVTEAARKRAIAPDALPGDSHLFLTDIKELAVVSLADTADHLVVEWWNEQRGYARTTRA